MHNDVPRGTDECARIGDLALFVHAKRVRSYLGRICGPRLSLGGGGSRGVADRQTDGPVAEVGYEVESAAECFDIAGDDIE
jgi:hypothetical protein